MDLAQAIAAGLRQLTIWASVESVMNMEYWKPKATWRYRPHGPWKPEEHELLREDTTYGEWLQKEADRISKDKNRIAVVVEKKKQAALFVDCVTSGCKHKKHDHVSVWSSPPGFKV